MSAILGVRGPAVDGSRPSSHAGRPLDPPRRGRQVERRRPRRARLVASSGPASRRTASTSSSSTSSGASVSTAQGWSSSSSSPASRSRVDAGVVAVARPAGRRPPGRRPRRRRCRARRSSSQPASWAQERPVRLQPVDVVELVGGRASGPASCSCGSGLARRPAGERDRQHVRVADRRPRPAASRSPRPRSRAPRRSRGPAPPSGVSPGSTLPPGNSQRPAASAGRYAGRRAPARRARSPRRRRASHGRATLPFASVHLDPHRPDLQPRRSTRWPAHGGRVGLDGGAGRPGPAAATYRGARAAPAPGLDLGPRRPPRRRAGGRRASSGRAGRSGASRSSWYAKDGGSPGVASSTWRRAATGT